MTRRKVKEELKKPDFMMVAFEYATTWIREHVKLCIIVLSGVVVVGAAVTAYRVYENAEIDKVQYQLTEAIAAYQEYTINGSGPSLQRAESLFKNISASRRKELDKIAELYLAKIYYTQGKMSDARSLYNDVKNQPSNAILKTLAGIALQQIPQAAK